MYICAECNAVVDNPQAQGRVLNFFRQRYCDKLHPLWNDSIGPYREWSFFSSLATAGAIVFLSLILTLLAFGTDTFGDVVGQIGVHSGPRSRQDLNPERTPRVVRIGERERRDC